MDLSSAAGSNFPAVFVEFQPGTTGRIKKVIEIPAGFLNKAEEAIRQG